MKLSAIIVGISISILAPWSHAAPFVISDVLAPGVTQCGVFVDSNAKRVIPVTPVLLPVAGNICQLDVFDFTVGTHSVTMTAIANDPVWGSQESPQSTPPLGVPRPAMPPVPSGLRMKP